MPTVKHGQPEQGELVPWGNRIDHMVGNIVVSANR